jgi:hypothetical protein
MFSIESLERGIEGCEKNIKVFDEAIDKERNQIKEYYRMIDVLRKKELAQKALKKVEETINADSSKLLQ